MPPVRAPFFQAPQRHLAAFLLASLTALAQPAQAQDKPAIEQQFQRWLTQTIWPRAKAKGVTRATFDSAFQGVTLNWSLPDLVPPGSKAGPARDQHQAEFGTPSAYFAPAGLRATTATGREMAKKHAQSLVCPLKSCLPSGAAKAALVAQRSPITLLKCWAPKVLCPPERPILPMNSSPRCKFPKPATPRPVPGPQAGQAHWDSHNSCRRIF